MVSSLKLLNLRPLHEPPACTSRQEEYKLPPQVPLLLAVPTLLSAKSFLFLLDTELNIGSGTLDQDRHAVSENFQTNSGFGLAGGIPVLYLSLTEK
jgi:hypothetical protein